MDSFSLEHCAQISAPALPIFHATGALDLRLADCMDVMREFPDKHFDLAIVDPPYGIEINMNQGRRKGDVIKHARKKWDANPPAVEYWKELTRVSRKQIVWGANNFEWIPAHNGWVVWDKDITGDVGFSRAELAYNSGINIVDMVRIRAQSGAETYTNKIHPTQKPVKLYRWLLDNYAKQGQRILDTHLGSGSHAIACHYFGAHLTACEIDADYYVAACARIARETAQMTLAHQ
jgi:site-specific DNA-methyltransferase (adenine-specific)